MKSTVQSDMEAWRHPRTQPCTQACTQSVTHSGAYFGMESGTEHPLREKCCPLGFSALQIAVLSILKGCQAVIAYWRIAQHVTGAYGLQVTEGAVRGAMERLFRRGFLLRSRAAVGHIKGNRYAFSADPCPHIQPYASRMESGTDSGVESAAQSGENAAPSIPKETDRNDLLSFSSTASREAVYRLESMTESDIAFHWPELARLGFGTHQVRQILHRLAETGTGPERIIQGLTHAAWELAAGRMCDSTGKPVANPVNWVFIILARQGYYPRPEGYVSPQEQAELDAAKEAERLATAYEARQTAEADAWMTRLAPDERSAILGTQNSVVRMPEEVFLRRHFRAEVWPTLRSEGKI